MKRLTQWLLAGLALTCLTSPVVEAAPKIINIRDKDFTNIAEPSDAMTATTLTRHPAPRTEDQVREDVNFALQAFYYEFGAAKRADLLQMSDEAFYDKAAALTIEALQDAFGSHITADYSVDFLGHPVTLGKELRDGVEISVNSHQVANKYEIKDLHIDGDTVQATVEVRYIDDFQYEVMLSYAPNFQSEIVPYIQQMRTKYDSASPDYRVIALLINRALRNYAVNEVNLDGNHRVPLEYPSRMRPLQLTFVYDAEGRLTLPDETILAILQIKNHDWKSQDDGTSADEASSQEASESSE